MNFRTKILVKILRTFYKDHAIAWNTYHPKGIGILIKKPHCILENVHISGKENVGLQIDILQDIKFKNFSVVGDYHK